jgi:CheY-like chemotaxis protein
VQGDRALDRGQGGLGIGLTLVKRLVELHQGTVGVASDGLGRGSTFTVTLPCISAVEPHRAPPTAVAALKSSSEVYGRRVLVVDDNVDAAESTAAFLRLEGHEVKAVHDGLQALASLKVFDPHVVVLDIGLPGLDGYAVARQLRERGDTSHVLLIALTGYGQKEDRARAAASGFDYHYVKPADPREIQAAIERGRNTAGEPALEAHRISGDA